MVSEFSFHKIILDTPEGFPINWVNGQMRIIAIPAVGIGAGAFHYGHLPYGHLPRRVGGIPTRIAEGGVDGFFRIVIHHRKAHPDIPVLVYPDAATPAI